MLSIKSYLYNYLIIKYKQENEQLKKMPDFFAKFLYITELQEIKIRPKSQKVG